MPVEIVTYHYVRPISESAYPKIKGLELDGFVRQLEFFRKKKKIVSTADVIEAVANKRDLSNDSVWLTFDDGYKDHYEYVAPVLERMGIDAAFFPVSDAYESKCLFDINKIHYILASIDSEEGLIKNLRAEMQSYGYTKKDFEKLWNSTDKSSRYDSEEVHFFKNMLQKDLPLNVRTKILNKILESVVSRTESDLSDELYMSKDELVSLYNRGFTIGSHAASHTRLNCLTYDDQKNELDKSLAALKGIIDNTAQWIMCYPHGAYNEDTLNLLSQMDCALALTTKVGSADIMTQNKYELTRLDTNDFPQ
jgi:peptidoglycan/xylan/chitin deacetylase (PgdA/CDA1 family)